MLKICLVFLKSEPRYAYKLYAYKKNTCICNLMSTQLPLLRFDEVITITTNHIAHLRLLKKKTQT